MTARELRTECTWAQQTLLERPGELSPAAADRLQTHLAQCVACRQAQDFDRCLRSALHQQPVLPGPGRVTGRVQHLRQRRRRLERLAWGMAAAALLGTAGLAFWSGPSRPTLAPPVAVQTRQPPAERPDLTDQELAYLFTVPIARVCPDPPPVP